MRYVKYTMKANAQTLVKYSPKKIVNRFFNFNINSLTRNTLEDLIEHDYLVLTDSPEDFVNEDVIPVLNKPIPALASSFIYVNPDLPKKDLVRKVREELVRVLFNETDEDKIIELSKSEAIVEESKKYLDFLDWYYLRSSKIYSKHALEFYGMKSYSLKEALRTKFTPEKAYSYVDGLLFKVKDFSGNYSLISLSEIEKGLAVASHPKLMPRVQFQYYNYTLNGFFPSTSTDIDYSFILSNVPIIYYNVPSKRNEKIMYGDWTKMFAESSDFPITSHFNERFQLRRKYSKLPHFLFYGAVASYYLLARKLWDSKYSKITFAPFPLPRKSLIEYMNYLRYGVIALENDKVRTLNKFELDFFAMKHVQKYHDIFTELTDAEMPIKEYVLSFE